MNRRSQPTLVLGGTGKIGRRVVERLTARGLPVRVGSRSGEPPFDWDYASTWDPVLKGVGSAYVAHYWDAMAGAAETLGSFADGVQPALGRAPRDFSEYPRDAAVTGSERRPTWHKR
jgi:uncharacterized protein YbjT (DUF2867 family)